MRSRNHYMICQSSPLRASATRLAGAMVPLPYRIASLRAQSPLWSRWASPNRMHFKRCGMRMIPPSLSRFMRRGSNQPLGPSFWGPAQRQQWGRLQGSRHGTTTRVPQGFGRKHESYGRCQPAYPEAHCCGLYGWIVCGKFQKIEVVLAHESENEGPRHTGLVAPLMSQSYS